MSGLLTGGSSIAVLLLLLALGIPVAYSMGLVAIAGIYLTIGDQFLFSLTTAMPWASASEFTFVVIPMFVLMGALAARAGFVEEIYDAAYRLTAGLKGGLFYTTILASTGFAAISGSTLVSSSVFTRMALPQMTKFGYDRDISAGCIAASGTLAALIPPSVAMVLFGILTNVSIGHLLVAGIVPGLLTAISYMIGVRLFLFKKPHWAPLPKSTYTARQKMSGLLNVWSMVLVSVIVLGGIYGGLFSPSSAGAIGAFGVLLIALVRRKIDAEGIKSSFSEAVTITGVLFAIIIAGLLFSRMLTISGFVSDLNSVVLEIGMGRTGFTLVVIVIFIVLGMFIDTVSMLVVTLPFLFPIAINLGFDPVWFGIFVIKLVEIGAITPPVGLNLFAVIGASNGSLSTASMFRGVIPFLLIEIAILVIIILFPEISLWLPNMMLT